MGVEQRTGLGADGEDGEDADAMEWRLPADGDGAGEAGGRTRTRA